MDYTQYVIYIIINERSRLNMIYIDEKKKIFQYFNENLRLIKKQIYIIVNLCLNNIFI